MAIEGETERAGEADRFDRRAADRFDRSNRDRFDRSEKDRFDSEEKAARAEGRQADASTVGCLAFAAIVLLPAFLYFGFFGAVLIDEFVLEMRLIGELPEPVLDVLRFLYLPLIWLMDQFDG